MLPDNAIFVCIALPQPRFTLFPYTTLFRSSICAVVAGFAVARVIHASRFVLAPRQSPNGNNAAPLKRTWQSFHRTYRDRKSTRLNSSHVSISYAVFCLNKKKEPAQRRDAPD